MNFSQRYKECNPLETITKFKGVINDLDIEVKEEWINSVDDIYSVSIGLNNTSITTNGKGSTKEFALASAYGEMLERLQNMAHFRMKRRFDKFPFNLNCIISPDEILTQNFGINPNQIKWFNEAIKKNEKCFLNKFKLLWENVYTKNYESKIVNLDYNSIDSDDRITIPLTMVDYYYGTNGMASGNTMYEAIVQGISEIIERATLSTIIKEQLTPPDITDYVKENYEYLSRLINNIEKENEHFKLLVKDGSLGRDIPVIIVIF